MKTREEIDQELAQAWQAEVAHNQQEAYTIYSRALQDLDEFRHAAPPEDQEALNSLT